MGAKVPYSSRKKNYRQSWASKKSRSDFPLNRARKNNKQIVERVISKHTQMSFSVHIRAVSNGEMYTVVVKDIALFGEFFPHKQGLL